MTTSWADQSARLGRRGVLAGAAGVATAVSSGALGGQTPTAAAVSPVVAEATVMRFAVVTDTHLNAEITSRGQQMSLIYRWIEGRNPDVVLHCGDITDYGADDEFAAYRATIPAGLADRISHVAGNHEWRWDPTVLQSYEALFGPADHSTILKGVRFIGISPQQYLEEPALIGRERLDWLEQQLADSVGDRGEPVILFQHMPIGLGSYFINDGDDLLALLRRYNVRAIFAGHTHAERVVDLNGITQITGNAGRNGWAYWVEVRQGSYGRRIVVQSVVPTADGGATLAEVATVPMSGVRPALLPERVTSRGQVGSVSVEVLAPAARAVGVQALPQHIFGGTLTPNLTPLTDQGGGRFVGQVALPPVGGEHRLEIEVQRAVGRQLMNRRVSVGDSRVLDAVRVGGQVQPALLRLTEPASDGVVAASTTGVLSRFAVSSDRLEQVWTRQLGAMSRGGAAIGGRIVVPSIDHQLTAVNASTGATLWSRDLGAPSLSRLVATEVAGTPAVFATAGDATYRLDPATGAVVWRGVHGTLFAGELAVDEQAVYLGNGLGEAVALDIETGDRLWAVDLSGRTDRYAKRLYGPWGCTVLLASDNSVIYNTVASTVSLDRASGAVRWKLTGGHPYSPGLVLPEGVVLASEFWKVDLIDPASGAITWTVPGPPAQQQRYLSSGLIADGDSLLVVSVASRLQRIALADGQVTDLAQLCAANTFSTPVLVGSGADRRLVVGSQDGVLRLVRVAS